MIKPNFLIIGAARSGTSALAEFIRQHPEVYFSEPKEPHYLSFANQKVQFAGRGDDIMINQRAITDDARYWSLFEGAGNAKAIGEGSVSTLYYHAQSVPRIRQLLPTVKMFVVLRNPIDRAFSSFLYMRSRGHEEHATFAPALDAEAKRIEENWHHIWHYTQMGMYVEQLRPFLSEFGSQVRVYLHEDMTQGGDDFYRDVYSFLGIDPTFRPQTEIEINRSGEPKNKLLQRLIRETVRRPWLRTLVRASLPRRLRMKLQSSNLQRNDMSEEDRLRLVECFKPTINTLGTLLQRDLSPWLTGQPVATRFADTNAKHTGS